MVPIIQLDNVTLERDHVILDKIDWQVLTGENWVIMGANGSGKSSIVNMLTGYLHPTSGEVRVLEDFMSDEDGWLERRMNIAVVSSYVANLVEGDQYAGDVILTGRSGVVNFWKDADPKDVKKTREILTQIGAWDLCDREWACLSQGEKQKILIGRAIMNDAKMIVLDEACAGLDPAAREHYLQFVNRVIDQHPDLTVIMVTHHVEEIVSGFQKVLMLKDSKLVYKGDLEEGICNDVLSAVFDAGITVEKVEGRFHSRVSAVKDKVF